jgi:hypothetical protein
MIPFCDYLPFCLKKEVLASCANPVGFDTGTDIAELVYWNWNWNCTCTSVNAFVEEAVVAVLKMEPMQ